jgi:hypothetical protein
MAKIGNLDIYFSENDASLYQWLIELGKAGYNKNKLGRNCLEIGRLFSGSLSEAQDAANALIIVRNQYDSVANAMDEHRVLFKDGE